MLQNHREMARQVDNPSRKKEVRNGIDPYADPIRETARVIRISQEFSAWRVVEGMRQLSRHFFTTIEITRENHPAVVDGDPKRHFLSRHGTSYVRGPASRLSARDLLVEAF